MLCACIPLFYSYEYIHLNEENMEVIDYGTINGMYNQKKMPLRYVLKTKRYNIYANVIGKRKRRLKFRIVNNNKENLIIKGEANYNKYAGFIYRDKWHLNEVDKNEMIFLWSGREGTAPKFKKLFITIKVYSGKDVLLAEHKVNYSIKENGFFIEMDGP